MKGSKFLENNSFFCPDFKTNRDEYKIKSIEEYQKKWQASVSNPQGFWAEEAARNLTWVKPFTKVYSRQQQQIEWFSDGKLNVSYNCLDRHLELHPEKTAIIWENEKGQGASYSYKELYEKVLKFSACLKSLGLTAGDCVTLYLSMTPDLVVSMLSCARLGLIHNVVFAGFSSESLRSRVIDSESKLVITSDAFYRKNKIIRLKEIVDQAVENISTLKNILVFNNEVTIVTMKEGRDFWVNDLLCQEESVETQVEGFCSEQALFILYTSGSTGKPKGLLHTSAGYLLGANLTSQYLFNLGKDDIFWCTADIGWITGHTYVVYGPLSCGATIFMYDGAPNTPDWGRWWSLIEEYKITKLYTAPTAIRMCMKQGDLWPNKYDLSTLKLLGTVGEPINPKAWQWYFETIGQKKCPILDTWWQTETGSIMIAPFPGISGLKPGCASLPFFGVNPKVVDSSHNEELQNKNGSLVIQNPWPSIARTIYKDHRRYEKEYWCSETNCYKTNDGALKDQEGDFWILGRLDDVINISGHRLSTMEVESFMVSHPIVVESSCVGIKDDITGEALCCFVVLKEKQVVQNQDLTKQLLSDYLVSSIGAFVKPKLIVLCPSLPKTRSGKIMRRILRDLASGETVKGDLSTLEDPTFLNTVL